MANIITVITVIQYSLSAYNYYMMYTCILKYSALLWIASYLLSSKLT